MVIKPIKYCLVLIAFFVLPLMAGQRDYRSPFDVGMGARELGKGGAGVGGLSNAGAIYWNPALLALGDRPEIQLFHMNLFMDTRYQFLAASYPTLSSGSFGLGIGDLSSGKFVRYNDYDISGTFSSRQNLLLFGYGFSPLKQLALGASIKGALFDIAEYQGSGFGFDIGALYSAFIVKGASIGLKVADIAGPRMKLHEIEQRFPVSVRGGLAYTRTFSGLSTLFNLDVENTEKSGTDIYTGAEIGINEILFARFGYMADKLTLGGGIAYYSFRFDYAYAGLGDLGTSHRISLSYAFGGSVEKRREANQANLIKDKIEELNNQSKAENQRRLDEQLTQARDFEQTGDYYKSVEAYYRVLALDDQNAEARQKIASLIEQIKLDVSRQASNNYINTLIARQLELGNNYLSKKQYDKAAEQFGFVLILDPQNQTAKGQLAAMDTTRRAEITRNKAAARESIQGGNYRRALESLDNVLALAPDDQQAQQSRTEIYRKIESSKHLDKALRLYDQENYLAASVQADSALLLNPQSEGAKGLKHRLAQYTAKETTLEDIKKNSDHWRIYIQGMEKYQAGDYDKALELWRSLQSDYPNNPNLKRNIEQAAERAPKR